VYSRVDAWQDLGSLARAIEHNVGERPLILFAPDETTRAMIDMFARTHVGLVPGPIDAAALAHLKAATAAAPRSLILVQLPGRAPWREPPQAPDVATALSWLPAAGLQPAKSFFLPHGRRYALLEISPR
jgi:hypothetical protein